MSDTVRVYRAISKLYENYRGVFSGESNKYENNKENEDSCYDLCPMPHDDSTALHDVMRSEHSSKYFFAFKDLKQFLDVFPCPSGRKACERTVIAIYEVKSEYVVYGKKQMVFKKEFAKIVGALHFEKLTPIGFIGIKEEQRQ